MEEMEVLDEVAAMLRHLLVEQQQHRHQQLVTQGAAAPTHVQTLCVHTHKQIKG